MTGAGWRARAARGGGRAVARWGGAALIVSSLVGVGTALPTARATVPASARQADSLLSAARSNATAARALKEWSRRASLPQLVYLLRRPGAELAGLGPELAQRALDSAPEARATLRLRLALRLAALKPGDRRVAHGLGLLLGRAGALPARPEASVFRVGAVLPQQGDYEVFGRSVREGLAAGLVEFSRGSGLGADLRVLDSSGEGTGAAAARADTLSWSCGVLVGELLSPATYAMASLARGAGLPLISPSAPDESVGAVGPGTFQVGPSRYEQGMRLGRALLAGRPSTRVALLVASTEVENPRAMGFRAVAESLGAQIVWSGNYAPGAQDLRGAIRTLKRQSPQVLFWDGESREAEVLVRQLTQERVTVALCGGAALDPEQLHQEIRSLVEGVVFVGEDWTLPEPQQTAFASALAGVRGSTPNRLQLRGYLAGRAIAAALSAGALCPEELQSMLAARVSPHPFLRARGFLHFAAGEVELPVYRVERGRAVPLKIQ